MSDQSNDADKVERQPTSPVVQFVDALPARTRKGGDVRKSKYDAVYDMLKEHPGQWAFIGEGKALHGALANYKKRRDLDDFHVAWRAGSVYAGVAIPEAQEDASAAPAPAASADADRPATEDEVAATGWPTGSESAVTAGTSEGESGDGWA